MNPLDELRGDVDYVHPLERARIIGDQDDARWEKKRELNRFDGADNAAARWQQQMAVERAEIARNGYATGTRRTSAGGRRPESRAHRRTQSGAGTPRPGGVRAAAPHRGQSLEATQALAREKGPTHR